MIFTDTQKPISKETILEIEKKLNLQFPVALKDQYFQCNGGDPDPYVYEDENLDTVVSRFIPLTSSDDERTAVDIYAHLVLQKKIVPLNYFPFAVDGGGDYFFIDCESKDGVVYFYRSDADAIDSRLLSLNLGIKEFWEQLKSE